jgi:hypothetical protein
MRSQSDIYSRTVLFQSGKRFQPRETNVGRLQEPRDETYLRSTSAPLFINKVERGTLPIKHQKLPPVPINPVIELEVPTIRETRNIVNTDGYPRHPLQADADISRRAKQQALAEDYNRLKVDLNGLKLEESRIESINPDEQAKSDILEYLQSIGADPAEVKQLSQDWDDADYEVKRKLYGADYRANYETLTKTVKSRIANYEQKINEAENILDPGKRARELQEQQLKVLQDMQKSQQDLFNKLLRQEINKEDQKAMEDLMGMSLASSTPRSSQSSIPDINKYFGPDSSFDLISWAKLVKSPTINYKAWATNLIPEIHGKLSFAEAVKIVADQYVAIGRIPESTDLRPIAKEIKEDYDEGGFIADIYTRLVNAGAPASEDTVKASILTYTAVLFEQVLGSKSKEETITKVLGLEELPVELADALYATIPGSPPRSPSTSPKSQVESKTASPKAESPKQKISAFSLSSGFSNVLSPGLTKNQILGMLETAASGAIDSRTKATLMTKMAMEIESIANTDAAKADFYNKWVSVIDDEINSTLVRKSDVEIQKIFDNVPADESKGEDYFEFLYKKFSDDKVRDYFKKASQTSKVNADALRALFNKLASKSKIPAEGYGVLYFLYGLSLLNSTPKLSLNWRKAKPIKSADKLVKAINELK